MLYDGCGVAMVTNWKEGEKTIKIIIKRKKKKKNNPYKTIKQKKTTTKRRKKKNNKKTKTKNNKQNHYKKKKKTQIKTTGNEKSVASRIDGDGRGLAIGYW